MKIAALARACVHCGLCIESCPTYRLDREEADSPRGRILLLAALEEGRIAPREVRRHLDRCVGCVACESACPSGVPYGGLLESGRRALGGPPWYWRAVLKRPRLLRLLVRLRRTPPRGRALGWPSPPARPKARVALHLGCVTPVLFPRLAAEAAHLLVRRGYRVEVPLGQTCCGALQRHAGLDARALEERNARAFAGYDLAVSAAAGCSTTEGLTDICRLLLDESPLGGRLQSPLRVAYDAPCHLLHAQGIDAAPLLDGIEGVERVPLPGADECCGAGGLYMVRQRRLARRVRARKLDRIEASGAQVVVSPNPGCLFWLWQGLRERRSPIEVLHPVSLLARAHGIDRAR